MEELYQRELYGPTLAVKIESLGATAVAIANRWALGWEERVKAMIADKTLLLALTTQAEEEKAVLSVTMGMGHLSNMEILALNEVRMEPPREVMSRDSVTHLIVRSTA